jgi:Asp-tRNA(Asn)/Glu-tRNA(Gln) amidotransferase A subunit family amidase
MIRESAVEIAEAVRQGERSAVEMVEAALGAVDTVDGPFKRGIDGGLGWG